MKDGLGAPQSVLVLGGTSDIAQATLRRLIAARTRRVVLAGRPSPTLDARAEELRGLGAEVEVTGFDAADPDRYAKNLAELFADGDIDVVLLAFGVLGDQAEGERDPAAAARVASVNYVGALSAGLVCAQELRAQGHGTLVVLSSVAGERARKANFIYGSSKAGLDAFAQGLGDSLVGSGVRVLVVRPGFVRTKMTAGMRDAPLATTPEAVADAIVRGLASGARTVWVPGVMRYVMSGIRHLPGPVFRRLPL